MNAADRNLALRRGVPTNITISLESLQNQIKTTPRDEIEKSFLLHRICHGSNVTGEMISCVIGTYPEATSWLSNYYCPNHFGPGIGSSSLAIHLACLNSNCPSSVIKLLIESNPSSLLQLSLLDHRKLFINGADTLYDYDVGDIDDHLCEGLPLHFYLTRPSNNIDLDIVKLMVNTYPESLLMPYESGWNHGVPWELKYAKPLHTILSNPSINQKKSLRVIEFMIESSPSTLTCTTYFDASPLHIACYNEHIVPEVIELLISSADRIRENICGFRDYRESLPIHKLCESESLDDDVFAKILRLLIRAYPDSVLQGDRDDHIPRVSADMYRKSFGGFEVISEAYLDYMTREENRLDPTVFHKACHDSEIKAVEYLYDKFTGILNVRCENGCLPIHHALSGGLRGREDVIKFLLRKDPRCSSKPLRENDPCHLLLHGACRNPPNIDTIKIIFDDYPEAILIRDREGKRPTDYLDGDSNGEITSFMETQQSYALRAMDIGIMTTPNANGQLLLHRVLSCNDISLGTVKLFTKANPAAMKVADNQSSFPLHIACQQASVDIIEYLIDIYNGCLEAKDVYGDTILHCACRGGNHSVVKYLLKGQTSIYEMNNNRELPFQLLLQAGKNAAGAERTSFIETLWLMLIMHPESVIP